MNQISYFIRSGCRWVKVTTSVAQWARLPHVVGPLSCKATGLLLLGALTGSVPAGHLPAAVGQPHRIAQAPPAPSTSSPDGLGSLFTYPPAADGTDDDKTARVGNVVGFGGAANVVRSDLGTISTGMPDLIVEQALPDLQTASPSLGSISITPPGPIPPDETTAPVAPSAMVVSEPKSLTLLGLAIAVLAVGRFAARRKRIDPASAPHADAIGPGDAPACSLAAKPLRDTV